MLDTDATNNVMDLKEAKRLGLRTTRRSDIEIKIIGAKPMRNLGWDWDVKTRVEGWQGKLDFLITLLDDYKIVVGLDFVDKAHATINLLKKTLDFPRIRRETEGLERLHKAREHSRWGWNECERLGWHVLVHAQPSVKGILVQDRNMSSANPSGKSQRDRLVEIEEQMLYLVEVPDSIRYLESRLDEVSEKTNTIDAVAGRVEGFPIQKLMARVDTLETNINIGRTVNYERGDSSTSSVRPY
ncbi:uncharacterized protein E5676_scaffold216G00090 [Cucumis melo var. makuwa]|uniref:Uncharacterized protein n=1 Tax=Cucumis melo var. makuwa TaxID=1194695 RepID=A0A5A7UQ97_CUCMM|nr:uncharacterized protein E6C27_scaffold280G002130 [Cucumis melo var. makuwa]TYK30043.1 uncharacterized protein E5676_scaffold216G00090 [Cucumis melo var. makuwa]